MILMSLVRIVDDQPTPHLSPGRSCRWIGDFESGGGQGAGDTMREEGTS